MRMPGKKLRLPVFTKKKVQIMKKINKIYIQKE